MSETEQNTPLDPDGATALSEASETPAEEQPTEREKEEERGRLNKRLGYLTSRASKAERELEETRAKLAAIENHLRTAGGQPVANPQAAVDAEVQRRVEEERAKEIGQRFWAAGSAAYPDWKQRCDDLQAMGAVPISMLFAEMPDGHRIAAALRDAPEELEEILAHPGERARAVALGKFAAKLTAAPNRNVSRAPAPPKPIQGRANPVYNTYQETDTNKLAQYYAEQAMEQRRRG